MVSEEHVCRQGIRCFCDLFVGRDGTQKPLGGRQIQSLADQDAVSLLTKHSPRHLSTLSLVDLGHGILIYRPTARELLVRRRDGNDSVGVRVGDNEQIIEIGLPAAQTCDR